MKRRTLDLLFSAGGLLMAGFVLVAGLVLSSNAHFAKSYVRDELSKEQMTFKTADKLTPAERAWTTARTGCLITYAGQHVATGKQAECWAKEYVGGHLRDPQKIPGANGLTYAQLGDVQTDLRTKITAAQTSGDPKLADLQKQLTDVTAARETVFKGEMLRGALLTTYGFSVLGTRAGEAAAVAYAIAGLLLLMSIAGFVHALTTPKERLLHLPDHVHSPADLVNA